MTRNRKDLALAAALGISASHVRRLVARGMPTSIAAAQRWRSRNLAGRVHSGDGLLAARTSLALEQAERLRQKRLAAGDRLIETEYLRRLLADLQEKFQARLAHVEQRFKAAYPDLPDAVYDLIRANHKDALALMAPDTVFPKRTEH